MVLEENQENEINDENNENSKTDSKEESLDNIIKDNQPTGIY